MKFLRKVNLYFYSFKEKAENIKYIFRSQFIVNRLLHVTASITVDHSSYPNGLGSRVMVFNATFNNISVISWQLVLLVEENGVPGENHRPTCLKSLINFITYDNVVSSTSHHQI